MQNKNKFTPSVENLENINLLSVAGLRHPVTTHHPKPVTAHHPATVTKPVAVNHPVIATQVKPSVSQDRGTSINGQFLNSLTPPAGEGTPYKISGTGPLKINGVIYNAKISGLISSQNFTGYMDIATDVGTMKLQVVALNDMSLGQYNIVQGTDQFEKAAGYGVVKISTTGVAFNPHQFVSKLNGPKIIGHAYVNAATPIWTFTNVAPIAIISTAYKNAVVSGTIIDGYGTISIDTPSGNLSLGVVTTYTAGNGYYTIIKGTGEFVGLQGYGVMIVSTAYNGKYKIDFNPNQ